MAEEKQGVIRGRITRRDGHNDQGQVASGVTVKTSVFDE